MRLIDADALKAEFTGNFGRELWHYTGIWATIDVAPTIDAAPVVRCGECKYWATEAIGEDGWCENPDGLDNIAKQTDFCSYGERKDGDTNG